MRMQHYAIFLQGFSFDIKYKNTKLLGNADCLSRLPIQISTTATHDVVDVYELETVQNLPFAAKDLATAEDEQLLKVLKALREKSKIPAKLRFNINQAAFSIQRRILFAMARS